MPMYSALLQNMFSSNNFLLQIQVNKTNIAFIYRQMTMFTARPSVRSQPKLPEYWIPQDLKIVLIKNVESYVDISEKSENFRNVLQKLKNVDRLELTECHYLQFLKLALYLEEYQQNIDLRKFNMYGKKIQRVPGTLKVYRISFKDLDKDHPLHKCCNLIEVINPKDVMKTKFVLRVQKILEDYVIAVAYPE